MHPDQNNRSPSFLSSLVCNHSFPGGNLLLHRLVEDNPYDNDKGNEGYWSRIAPRLQAIGNETSVNALNGSGYSVLHLAVLADNIVMVEELLRNLSFIDVDVRDGDGKTPLHLVAKKGNVAILNVLLRDERIKVNRQDRIVELLLWKQ